MGEYVKPGGVLVISMPNSVNLRKRLSVMFGKTNYAPVDVQYLSPPDEYRGHVREYTLAETVWIVEQNKFDVLAGTTFEHLAYEKLRFPLREIYLGIGNFIKTTRSSVLVVARKPLNWEPVEFNHERYKKSLSKTVPKGVAT
jgi:hypothetical protein